MNSPIIGLFGTCGSSKWRDMFIKKYQTMGIQFYNPLVENWTQACAIEESKHLSEDDIILFPVTGETYGMASLAEIGFAMQQVLNDGRKRALIVMIEPTLREELIVLNTQLAKESKNARALVIAHLEKTRKVSPTGTVRVVKNLEEMLEWSLFYHSQIKSHLDIFKGMIGSEGC